MNLIFRLFLLILKKLYSQRTNDPLQTTQTSFLCLPHDSDFHLHMTNSRFSSFCDLARVGALFDHGVMSKLIKHGYAPIVTAQNFIHFKEIAMFKSFTVTSRIVGWDDRFWFFQHDFYQRGELKATAFAKGFFVCKRKVVPFPEIVALSGKTLPSPPLPPMVAEWKAACDSLFRSAKKP
jgi:acyl-CoA thioesterase FadM